MRMIVQIISLRFFNGHDSIVFGLGHFHENNSASIMSERFYAYDSTSNWSETLS